MWWRMTTAHIIFFLQLVACSLLIVSILVIFEDEIRKKMRHVLRLLAGNWNGEKRRIANLKNSEGLSGPSSTRSKKNWGWISNWKNKWRGYATTVGIALIGLFAIVMFAIVPISNRIGPISVTTRYLIYLPHVPQVMDDWTYIGHDLDPKSQMFGKDFLIVFCKQAGYNPPFDEGETFEYLSFKNYGACWEPVSYRMVRDPDRAYTLVVK